MQAIILAAGKGTRMGEFTQAIPKPMIELNGTTLIKRALDTLAATDINKITIVVGHQGKKIMEHIGNSYKNTLLTYINNTDYDTKNNIHSIWLCRHDLIKDDTIIIDGDVIFDKESIQEIKNGSKNVIMISPYAVWMNGTVIEYNKDNLPNITKACIPSFDSERFKTVNIYKFSKEFSQNVYLPLIQKELEKNNFHLYYEDVISSDILKQYFNMYKLKENEKWYEVDNPVDLASATLLFPPENETYLTLVNSFGGHWRVPQIKDFYYLNNPFFPTREILDDMKNAFEQLLINYPSGRTIVDHLASVIFKIKKDYILVANGASEIIDCLLRNIEGKYGTFLPTFDEYINRLSPEKTITYELNNKDFKLSIEEVKKLSDNVQNIVIINPNNPTGQIIHKKELLSILKFLKEKKKNLIVDESFADFCHEDISLINSSILAEYDNLYIIKSMGKSYGIPGIRLGVLITSNAETLSRVKKKLPIWNINSIGEYFLEVFPRHEKHFINACINVQAEREYLFRELSEIKSLKVFHSHGNFILSRLMNNYSLQELVLWLYKKYGIFLKDCSGKRGFNEEPFLRIGIRNRKDNELLVKALHEFFELNKK